MLFLLQGTAVRFPLLVDGTLEQVTEMSDIIARMGAPGVIIPYHTDITSGEVLLERLKSYELDKDFNRLPLNIRALSHFVKLDG